MTLAGTRPPTLDEWNKYELHHRARLGAGFNHVVFIIRKDIEKEFKEVIGDRIASICSAHNVTSHWGQTPLNTDKENKMGLKVL